MNRLTAPDPQRSASNASRMTAKSSDQTIKRSRDITLTARACHSMTSSARSSNDFGIAIRNRFEEFGGGRKAEIGKVGQERTREAQPFVDPVGTVQIRIVDETFPAYDGPWLFEVHPHDDEDSIADVDRQLLKTLRVFDCGLRVVDRAGADDGKQPRVAAVEYGFDRASRSGYAFFAARGDRNLLEQYRRGQQRPDAADSKVVRSHVNP